MPIATITIIAIAAAKLQRANKTDCLRPRGNASAGLRRPMYWSPPNEPLASVTLLLPLNGSPLTLLTAGVRVFARQYRCQSSSASQHSLKSFCSSWNRHCNARMTCDSFSCVASSIRHQFKSTGSYHCLSREIESQGRAHNVRFWHLADICAAYENVRSRGQSGRRQRSLECPLLTQSCHHSANAHARILSASLAPPAAEGSIGFA